jgi:hypothetical protein
MTYRPSPSPILGAVIDPATFRDWIAAQVEAHGGQEGAAEHTGLTQSHISQILASDDYKPGLDKLMQIAMAQKCQDLSALFLRIEAWQRARAGGSPGSAPLRLTSRAGTGHSDTPQRIDEVVHGGGSLQALTPNEERIVHALMVRIGAAIALWGRGRHDPDVSAGHPTGTAPTDPEIRGPRAPRSKSGKKRPRSGRVRPD